MNEIENIKNELISLYNSIKSDVSPEYNNNKNPQNNFSALSLIKEIKELIYNNCIPSNTKLLKDYHQLESQIRKIEFDNKFLLSRLMSLKITNISLEIRLNAYISIENELDELKAKVKFEEG